MKARLGKTQNSQDKGVSLAVKRDGAVGLHERLRLVAKRDGAEVDRHVSGRVDDAGPLLLLPF